MASSADILTAIRELTNTLVRFSGALWLKQSSDSVRDGIWM